MMKLWLHCMAIAAFATVAILMPAIISPTTAKPSGIFNQLNGTWRGSGSIRLTGGNVQRIICRAYYNVKNGGAALGFAIRCASPDNKIELRAKLTDQNGILDGTWEERTYNATGNVAGRARSGVISLNIVGSVAGSIRISYSGGRQTVSISTATDGFQGITIDLRR